MKKINSFIKALINNAPGVIQSKRFWVSFIGGCSMIAVAFQPELKPYVPQIQASILAFGLFLIKGYSDQDKASAERGYNKYLNHTPVDTEADTVQLKKSSEI